MTERPSGRIFSGFAHHRTILCPNASNVVSSVCDRSVSAIISWGKRELTAGPANSDTDPIDHSGRKEQEVFGWFRGGGINDAGIYG
jgi:hypothetical protein